MHCSVLRIGQPRSLYSGGPSHLWTARAIGASVHFVAGTDLTHLGLTQSGCDTQAIAELANEARPAYDECERISEAELKHVARVRRVR